MDYTLATKAQRTLLFTDALRSGAYKQTRHALEAHYSAQDVRCCAGGVAVRVAINNGVEVATDYMIDDQGLKFTVFIDPLHKGLRSAYFLHNLPSVLSFYGWPPAMSRFLMQANDTHSRSFVEIADLVVSCAGLPIPEAFRQLRVGS